MSDAHARPVTLGWPHDPRYRPVGRLVLGGVGARLDMPIDRIDELGLALDTLVRAATVDARLELEIQVAQEWIRVTVGRFTDDPLADPAVRRIVERLADDVTSSSAPDGHRVSMSASVPAPDGTV